MTMHESFALLDAGGRLMGQVQAGGACLLAPLHVVDVTRAGCTLTLAGREGGRQTIRIAQVHACDARWDVAMLHVAGWRHPAALPSLCLADPLEEAGDEVTVHGVVACPRACAHASPYASAHASPYASPYASPHAGLHGQRPGFAVQALHARIRAVVEVDRYAYRAASGRRTRLRRVRALLLDTAFAPGWSGAPVRTAADGRLLGFVHGNATFNDGAGICLLPDAGSPVLRALRQGNGDQHGYG